MTKRYEILARGQGGQGGEVVNVILATAEEVEKAYPGRFRIVEEPGRAAEAERGAILARIAELERACGIGRALRECLVNAPFCTDYLKEVDNEIAKLREQLGKGD